MAVIDSKYLEQLRDAGLIIRQPYPEGHSIEHGVIMNKPSTVAGNTVENLSIDFLGVVVNAPSTFFYSDGKIWVVAVMDKVPGPGPGDFQNRWDSPEEAVADILDYYFGDPKRMQEFQI